MSTLRSKLRTYAINEMTVASLQRDYEMFVMADTPEATLGVHDAMQSFRASYLWQYLPRPYRDSRAILLPRADARSMRVAAALHEAGFLDLGLYLRGLAARQTQRELIMISSGTGSLGYAQEHGQATLDLR